MASSLDYTLQSTSRAIVAFATLEALIEGFTRGCFRPAFHESADKTSTRIDRRLSVTLLVRATESVLSPFGWDREDISNALSEPRDTDLSRYGAVEPTRF
jgi:hypothetical protein